MTINPKDNATVNSDFNVNIDTQNMPLVYLPYNGIKINDMATQLADIYRNETEVDKKLFLRGGGICCVSKDRYSDSLFLESVSTQKACSEFEQVATLVKRKKVVTEGCDIDYEPTVCTSDHAGKVFASRTFQDNLPQIKIVTSAPAIVEKNGRCNIINSYDEQTGILSTGAPAEDVSLQEAKELLHGLLDDYDFVTVSDKSRALATLVSPALVFGGILHDRIPVAMLEADKSQSGKGFFNKLLCSIYNEQPVTVTQRGSGVGGTDEKFDAALAKGNPFISLDNFRGKLDSPQIESFLTESVYQARVPHTGYIDVDPSRYVILATSNNLEMTKDMANRANIIRIRKKGDSYSFKEFTEGNVLDHVNANQPKYLGAVFAVVKAWVEQGKKVTNDTRHDFRTWCRSLDWITQNLLGCAPLLDGHREAQIITTHPEAGWLKDVYSVVKEMNEEKKVLTAFQIAEYCALGDVDLAGTNGIPFDCLDSKGVKQVCSQIGRRFSTLLKKIGSDNQISIGGFSVGFGREKQTYASGKSEYANVYTFAPTT